MKGNKLFLFNFILTSILLGLMFFISPIKGYCSEVNVTNQTSEYFTLSRPDPSTYPSDLNYTCEVTFPSSLSFKCSIGPSTSTSSCTYYYGVLLHVVTTNGDYVVRVSDGSFSTVPPQPGSSKTVNNSLGLSGLGTYTFPGYFILCYIEYTSDGKIWRSGSNTLSGTLNSNTGSFNGTWQERSGEFPTWSVSSVNGTNVSYTNIQSASGDYMQILTQIYNELLDQGITLDDLYTELLDQGTSLDSLVKSLCFDFPKTIDGNYQLSTCFFNVSSFNSAVVFDNNPISLGYFAFDTSYLIGNPQLVFRVPSSHKVMFVSTYDNGVSCEPSYPFKKLDGSDVNVTINYTNSSAFTDFSKCLVFNIDSSIPTGTLVSCLIYRTQGIPVNVRFAMYDYVVSASDILDYMNKQWSGADVEVDPFINDIDTASGVQDSIHIMESGSWSDLNDNYTYTGLGSFSFNAFTGMKALTTIINRFYLKLPSQYALYIVGVMFIGIAAVLISAVGRVNKASDSNIKSHLPKMKKGKKG